jgi:hypothetical protein
MIRDTLKAVAVSGVVSMAVSFGMWHVAPATQARASEAQVSAQSPSQPVAEQARSSVSVSIDEVYSDGGYTYWLERADWQG